MYDVWGVYSFMSRNELRSHVEDILSFLSEETKEKVGVEKIQRELEKFMEYGVPIDQAKQTIIKKFTGNTSFNVPVSSERRLIADLQPNEKSVNLLGHIIAINPKEVSVRGGKKQIYYGIIGDESGTTTFTSWRDVNVEKGDVVEVLNAYTKEWRGEPQLNFGDRTQIKKTDRNRLPEAAFVPMVYKLKDLKSGIGRVEVVAKVLEVNKREIEVDGGKKEITSGVLGDETGKTQFTSWHDFKIKKDDVLRISGGYVKSWKGIPQLTFDENAEVEKLDEDKIRFEEIGRNQMRIYELEEKRGGLDVEVEGTVIEVRPGSGFIVRCPECNRVLKNNGCSVHGEVKGVADLRLKLVVDDGTGAVNTVLNKDLTEALLGRTVKECEKIKKEKLHEEMNRLFFGRKIRVKGNGLVDDFGVSIIAKDAELLKVDIGKEAEKIAAKIEEL